MYGKNGRFIQAHFRVCIGSLPVLHLQGAEGKSPAMLSYASSLMCLGSSFSFSVCSGGNWWVTRLLHHRLAPRLLHSLSSLISPGFPQNSLNPSVADVKLHMNHVTSSFSRLEQSG